MGAGPLISIVDDDEGIRQSLDGLLRSAGYSARCFASAEEALADPDIANSDCVITDLQMLRLNGIEFARRLRERNRDLPILLITAYPSAEVEHRAAEIGILLLSKPFQANDLLLMVERLLALHP